MSPPPPPPDAAPVPTDLASALALLQRFALMADSMPVLMAYYEQDGLRCAYANRAYAATFGHTPGGIVGRGLAEIVGAEALRQIEPHIERMFAQRQTVSYIRSMVDAAGQVHQFEVSLVPHLHEHGDVFADPQGAFVLINDITRFQDAQQALRDGEERLRKFMDASAEGIAFPREGVVSDVNPPILQMLGYRREDMLGRPVMDFVAPEHRPRAQQGYAHPSEQPYESALLDHRGEQVPVELIARVLPRPPGGARTHAPPGRARRLDRPAQPRRVHGRAGRGHRAPCQRCAVAGPAVRRPRPLQTGQRCAWPPGRRRAAAWRGRAAAGSAARWRGGGPFRRRRIRHPDARGGQPRRGAGGRPAPDRKS